MDGANDILVRRFSDLGTIAEFASQIDVLNMESARPSPFASFAHLENAILRGPSAAGSSRARIWFLGVFVEGSMIGFIALVLTRNYFFRLPARRLGFLVGREFDRPGIVARSANLGRAARAIYAYLNAHRREWDYVEFEQQDASSSLDPPPGGTRLRGCALREFPVWDNCTIFVRWSSMQDYFEALSRKFATNVKRQMRKLYSLGALEAICSNDPQSTPALLELFCDVERRSWKTELENAVGTDPAGLAYYRGLLEPRQPMKVTIVLLLLDGMPIAGFLGGEFDTASGIDYYALHVAYDGRYHAVAPGSAVLVLAMQRAIERRYACLNLLAGFTYYKSQWLAQATPMHTAQLYRKARLPFARRVLGDLKRSVWTRTNSMHQRFNPSKRRARSNRAADAESELRQLPNPHLGALDAADIEAILTRARSGRCENLSADDLLRLLPFLQPGG